MICHAEGNQLGIASNHADVLHWWPKHGVTMEDFRAAVKAAMEEEEIVTQEQFNAMMAEYLKQAGSTAPASWSQQARTWARESGDHRRGRGQGGAVRLLCHPGGNRADALAAEPAEIKRRGFADPEH